jgi:hypothetical protein
VERREIREDHRQEVSRHLVDQFAEVSRQHGVVFAVGQLDRPLGMVDYARSRGIPAVDLAVPENLTFPKDGHPTVEGQRFIADRAEVFFASLTRRDSSLAHSPVGDATPLD